MEPAIGQSLAQVSRDLPGLMAVLLLSLLLLLLTPGAT
jgi:hypothetical protein